METSRPARPWAAYAIAAGAGATIAVGLAVFYFFGGELGTPDPPFFLFWRPLASGWVLLALGAFVLALLAAARELRTPRLSPAAFALAALLLTLGLRLALATARSGPAAWDAVYTTTSSEGQNEYLPALPVFRYGTRAFLDRFAEVAPSLPTHPSAHPPGLLLSMHALGIHTAAGLAALTIGAGALATPLLYVLARSLLEERRARAAALLFAFSPSSLLYGATSTDALYVTLGLAAAATLLARRRVARAAGPLLLVLASFFSYPLLALGAWAALVAWRRDGLGAAVRLAAACAATLLAAYALLFALTGYDPLGSLRAANEVYHVGVYYSRPYAYWLFGSPAAWLAAMGLPLAWYALRALSARELTALALAAIIAVSALLGYSKAETERIWLFLVPLACLAAVRAMPARRVPLVLIFLSAQALAVEVLFDSIW